LPGQIGLVQATETIKLLIKKGTPLIGQFLLYDALDSRFKTFQIRKDPDCRLCGRDPVVKELIDYESFCQGALASR